MITDGLSALAVETNAVPLLEEVVPSLRADGFSLAPLCVVRVGLTDERRNCLSNIRPAGLPWREAAVRLHWLIRESLRRQLSGVALREDAPALAAGQSDGRLAP